MLLSHQLAGGRVLVVIMFHANLTFQGVNWITNYSLNIPEVAFLVFPSTYLMSTFYTKVC